jgi:parvulin-like peptidyl-prolyl isomerase
MSENFFVSVNGDKVDLKFALNTLRAFDDGLLLPLISTLVVRQYAAEKSLTITDEELQIAVDEYRYMSKMESGEVFRQALRDRHVSVAAFQVGMENLLLLNKAIDAISEDEVDAYFAEHQLDLEQVEIYSMRLEDKDMAEEMKSLLDEDEENFLALAERHSLDEATRKKGGYVGQLGRKDMTGEIEAAVFNAVEGDVVGPIKTPHGYNLFKVVKFHKPRKDDRNLRQSIKAILFDAKIQERMTNAEIECSLFEE